MKVPIHIKIITGFVLSLGAAVNMNVIFMYQADSAVFIAQIY